MIGWRGLRSPVRSLLLLALTAFFAADLHAQAIPAGAQSKLPARIRPDQVKPEFAKYVAALGPLAQSPSMAICVQNARQGDVRAVGAVMAVAKGYIGSRILEARSKGRTAQTPNVAVQPPSAASLASAPGTIAMYRRMAAGLKYCEALNKSMTDAQGNGRTQG